MENYFLLILAIILDLIIGDPVNPIHPVRLIGRLISLIENLLYHRKMSKGTSGLIGVIICLGIVLGIYTVLNLFAGLIPFGREILGIAVFYFAIAIKDLAIHGLRIKKELDEDNIDAARQQLAMIVSRDTDAMSRELIITSTVESISENSADSIFAPIFWGLILGPAGALAYRVINTMDAMWGYKNERYNKFGRAAALLDDAVNYIPARLTGIFICFASAITTSRPINAWKIMIRDHSATSSPNSGYPEAATAGAMGIQLGGEVSYFGKTEIKPFIGDRDRDPESGDIIFSMRIIATAVVLLLVSTAILLLPALLL